jgi:site-specific DNA recombinase
MNLTKAKETKTRVCCLYRVSTKGQVDKAENDIPMQKKACHEFAESKG